MLGPQPGQIGPHQFAEQLHLHIADYGIAHPVDQRGLNHLGQPPRDGQDRNGQRNGHQGPGLMAHHQVIDGRLQDRDQLGAQSGDQDRGNKRPDPGLPARRHIDPRNPTDQGADRQLGGLWGSGAHGPWGRLSGLGSQG